MTETKLIVNLTRGRCVCVGELANRPLPRMRGLMGRRCLPAGEGMLISPAPAVHTAFMRFPIDVLFLDRDMRVVEIVERLRPWRMASKRGARAVLELSAGECARCGVRNGDRLELRDRELRVRRGPRRGEGDGAGAAGASGEGSSPAAPALRIERGNRILRMRPLRILVVSHDRHFQTVMSLLLAHHDYAVTTTANIGRVAETIERERIDVAVIDASRLPAVAAAATVPELTRPVGLVLVADDPSPRTAGRPVLAKWGAFDELLAAISVADERRGAEAGRA